MNESVGEAVQVSAKVRLYGVTKEGLEGSGLWGRTDARCAAGTCLTRARRCMTQGSGTACHLRVVDSGAAAAHVSIGTTAVAVAAIAAPTLRAVKGVSTDVWGRKNEKGEGRSRGGVER